MRPRTVDQLIVCPLGEMVQYLVFGFLKLDLVDDRFLEISTTGSAEVGR
jgi:hypothetical protein